MNNLTENTLSLLRNYFAKQPVEKAYLFGSYSRGEAKMTSDIDILLEVDKELSLFHFAAIQMQLEDLLQKEVDLVSTKGLSPYIGKYIHQDKILLYERKNQ